MYFTVTGCGSGRQSEYLVRTVFNGNWLPGANEDTIREAQRIIGDVMGPDVALIDPGRETAKFAKAALERSGLLNDAGGHAEYYVSDDVESFHRLSEWFLGDYAGSDVHRISVDEYEV